MSSIIKITDDYIEECVKEFKDELIKCRMDGKSEINFKKTVSSDSEKAVLYIDSAAYAKMQALVSSFDKEVAWHGLAERMGDEKLHCYRIYDILCYPQIAGAVTVESDDERYGGWFDKLESDQVNNMRMQGHSHVNMSVYPSVTDDKDRANMLSMMPGDAFYIFMICNKRGEMNTKIYDMKKNKMFGNHEVSVYVYTDDMAEFIKEAKDFVRSVAVVTPIQKVNQEKAVEEKKKNEKREEKSVGNHKYSYIDDTWDGYEDYAYM